MAVTAGATLSRESFSGRRRWGGRAQLLVGALLVAYIFAAVNGIVFRHPWRFDLTEERVHSVSGETRATLALVSQPIDVVVQYFVPYGGAEFKSHRPRRRTVERARALLEQYHYWQPLVRVQAEVDCVAESDERWEKLHKDYGIEKVYDNRIVLVQGGAAGLKQVVTADDLAVFDTGGAHPGDPPVVKEFRGEKALTASIHRLLNQRRQVVYFTQDKRELGIPRSVGSASTVKVLVSELSSLGFECEPLLLSQVQSVPADCELLVIAGPEHDHSQAELDALEQYLLRDGRLLVTLGARRTTLEALLRKWGIDVGEGRVRVSGFEPGSKIVTENVVVSDFNPIHPATRVFRAGSYAQFYSPRPLGAAKESRVLDAEYLIRSGPSTERRRYYLVGTDGKELAGLDEEAGFVFAMAASQPALERPPPDWVQRQARIVVAAASSLLKDPPAPGNYESWSHRDFVMNCVRWLTARESEIALGPKESLHRRIDMNKAGTTVFVISVFIFPGVFFCLGLVVYFSRRS